MNKRITSIDALRAMTLFGILLVHANYGFGLDTHEGDVSIVDTVLRTFVVTFLTDKCITIFSMLFGVSFYLILRNPNNSGGRFLWRCFLLMLIGFFNKLLYTSDALMWYGFWGMCLVPMRKLKPRYIIWSAIILQMLSCYLASYHIGDMVFGPVEHVRYGSGIPIKEILTYKYAIIDYLRSSLNGGIFSTFSWFLIGYWIALVGIIERLEATVTIRIVVTLWLFYLIDFIVLDMTGGFPFDRLTNIFLATFAYASTIIYLYYHSVLINRFLSKFESYGKCGLTNYSLQNMGGVLFFSDFGLGLYRYSFSVILLFFVGFYLFQAFQSYLWLNVYKYGPMEYVWRVATAMKRFRLRRC